MGIQQEAQKVTLSIVPVMRIAVIVVLLVASVLTLAVFGTGSGRYVLTGSVLGFQGVSYFYVTGLWALVAGSCMAVATTMNWRKYSVLVDHESVLIGSSTLVPLWRREKRIPLSSVHLVTFRKHPGPGAISGVVVGCAWTGFVLQLAIPNLQLPFIEGIPVTGLVLLVFAVTIIVSSILVAWRPGLLVSIMHDRNEEELRFPGTTRPGSIEAALSPLLSRAGFSIISDGKSNQGRVSSCLFTSRMVEWVVNAGLLIFGVVVDIFVTAGCAVIPMSHVVAWSIVCFGILMMGFLKNEPGNSRSMNSYSTPERKASIQVVNARVLVLPFVVGMVGIAFEAYLAGKLVGVAMLGSVVPVISVVLHVALATFLVTWVMHSTLPCGDSKQVSRDKQQDFPRITMLLFSIHRFSCYFPDISIPIIKVLLGAGLAGGCFLAGLLLL